MKVLVTTPYVRIKIDEAARLLETEWLDFCNSAELRDVLEQALDLGQRHAVRGWIGNNQWMRTIRPQDQDWINNQWFPRFARLGVERLAVVVSADAFNRMGIDHIMSRATDHMPHETRYFDDPGAARVWAGFTEPDEIDPTPAPRRAV